MANDKSKSVEHKETKQAEAPKKTAEKTEKILNKMTEDK
jgi:hypothetical protein